MNAIGQILLKAGTNVLGLLSLATESLQVMIWRVAHQPYIDRVARGGEQSRFWRCVDAFLCCVARCRRSQVASLLAFKCVK
jgi:hypothetical protein